MESRTLTFRKSISPVFIRQFLKFILRFQQDYEARPTISYTFLPSSFCCRSAFNISQLPSTSSTRPDRTRTSNISMPGFRKRTASNTENSAGRNDLNSLDCCECSYDHADPSAPPPNSPNSSPSSSASSNNKLTRVKGYFNSKFLHNQHHWKETKDRVKRTCSWESCKDGKERYEDMFECEKCGRHVCVKCKGKTGQRRCGRE